MVAHSQALLADGSGQIVAVEGDMRYPGTILADERIHTAGIDLSAPACVILGCVLHFLDFNTASGVAAAFTDALAPGSFVIISVGYAAGQAGRDMEKAYTAQKGEQAFNHSPEQIVSFFDGLTLVPPGLVDATTWRPDEPASARQDRVAMILAGVGCRA